MRDGVLIPYLPVNPDQDTGHLLAQVIVPPLAVSTISDGLVAITGAMIAECLLQGLDLAEPVYLGAQFAVDTTGEETTSLITWVSSASKAHEVMEHHEDRPSSPSSCPTTPTQVKH